jgi:polyhydroxyalkanoate synthesis regulator protein
MLFKQHADKRNNMQSANLKQLIDKYGGAIHMSLPEHVKQASKVGPEQQAEINP